MVAFPDEPAEVMRQAHEIYDRTIRAALEPAHDGEFVVINVDSGEYVHGHDDAEVARRADERFGRARLATLRVGRRVAYSIGGIARSQA